MDVRPIAIFDSGIGGLPSLDALRHILPNEAYVYAADRKGFPYGRKTRDEVVSLACESIDKLVSICDPKLIVIACNTASQAALSAIRSSHPDIPVVGTVPAVRPAAQATQTGVIAVLSTDRSAVDPYLDGLIDRYAKGVTVIRLGAQALVDFLEEKFLDASEGERMAACEAALEPIRGTGADCVVLACTHFLHAVPYIAAVAGPSTRIIDSRDGVAQRAAALLRGSENASPVSGGGKRGAAYATGAPERWGNFPRFVDRFGLEFRGAL